MKAEVTISNIYWNKGLSNFFFRDQAYETLEELVTRSTMSGPDTLDALDEATDDMDIDDVEETFYSESVEYCADEFGIELEGDDARVVRAVCEEYNDDDCSPWSCGHTWTEAVKNCKNGIYDNFSDFFNN